MPFFRTSVFYTPELLRANPGFIFVFGDNTQRHGKGGQAFIRDEPNALGIATKWSPGGSDQDYFKDDPFSDVALLRDVLRAYKIALTQSVIVPFTTRVELGTGLSELPKRAPMLYATLAEHFTAEIPVADLVED